MPQLVAVQEARKRFNVGEATLFRWLRDGRLKRYTQPGQGHVTFVDAGALRRLTAPQVVLAKAQRQQRRSGYIRTSERFRHPKRPARTPQRRGESDRDYAARIDATREEAYERARGRLRR